jgi:hypothetical protein
MKTTNQEMLFCTECDKTTTHIGCETHTNHILHLLLSVFTGGLWLPVWLIIACTTHNPSLACVICGSVAIGKKELTEPAWDKTAIYGASKTSIEPLASKLSDKIFRD